MGFLQKVSKSMHVPILDPSMVTQSSLFLILGPKAALGNCAVGKKLDCGGLPTLAVAYKVLTSPVAFRCIEQRHHRVATRTYLTHKNKMFDMRFEYGVNVIVRIFNGNPASNFALRWNSNGLLESRPVLRRIRAGTPSAFYRFKVANDGRRMRK